jgi:hypothetical protein
LEPLGCQPVVIIGAARSGTNMLRDVLCRMPRVHTWPCDEIPYIWRHGNRNHPDDEFTAEMARPSVRAYIRGQFRKIAGIDASMVVEKTCANSLRLGFVASVVPEARFVIIVRHGPDAVASAMKRWTAGFGWRYSLAKARFVPPADLPIYAARYLGNRLRRLLSSERRLRTWGPIFHGMRQLPVDIALADLAAMQWRRCIERTEEDLKRMTPDRFHRLAYEDFVRDPRDRLAALLSFLEMPAKDRQIEVAVSHVRRSSVGKSSRTLSTDDLFRIERILSAPSIANAAESAAT